MRKLFKKLNRRKFFRAFFGLFAIFVYPEKVKPVVNNRPLHHTDEGFRNLDPSFKRAEPMEVFNWLISRGTRRSFTKEAAIIPSTSLNKNLIEQKDTDSVTWVGHSTAFIRCEGSTFLTDPIWSKTAGPFNVFGINRYSPATILMEEIPEASVVLISHNHYDHLDVDSVLYFAKNKKTKFFVPLGVKSWFTNLGIFNVTELDWWQEEFYNGFKIVCTPAQHFSGRTPFDNNNTLWASWTVLGKNKKFYFGGDSAYCSAFKEIGEKFGPFDLSLIPIGAYIPKNIMGPVHMNPKQALQAYLDVNSKIMLPIHWGTYRMADDPIDLPPKDFAEAALKQNVNWNLIEPFKIGETKVF